MVFGILLIFIGVAYCTNTREYPRFLQHLLFADSKTRFMRYVFILIFIVIAVLFVPELLSAQAPPPPPQPPTQTPIDGGVALLAAAGGAYAWKKLRSK